MVYHGGDTDDPGLRRYRPDAVPVETRLLPASSRLTAFPVTPGESRLFKGHEPVQHGSSGIPKVVNGAATVVTRFITVHPGSSNGMNRHLKPGQ